MTTCISDITKPVTATPTTLRLRLHSAAARAERRYEIRLSLVGVVSKKEKNVNMMIKVIKDCQEHKQMGTPSRVWSTYFRYALNELEKDSLLVSKAVIKNPGEKTIHEHTFPFRLLRDKLMNLENVNFESVSNVLEKFHVVTKITYEEDQRLKRHGLNNNMPEDWDRTNPFARYEAVGISICRDTESS